jgi:hypothetical protein
MGEVILTDIGIGRLLGQPVAEGLGVVGAPGLVIHTPSLVHVTAQELIPDGEVVHG